MPTLRGTSRWRKLLELEGGLDQILCASRIKCRQFRHLTRHVSKLYDTHVLPSLAKIAQVKGKGARAGTGPAPTDAGRVL